MLADYLLSAAGAVNLPGRWCPPESCGIGSQLIYKFADSLIAIGYQKPLQLDDLWDVPRYMDAHVVCDEFAGQLAATQDPIHSPQVLMSALSCACVL